MYLTLQIPCKSAQTTSTKILPESTTIGRKIENEVFVFFCVYTQTKPEYCVVTGREIFPSAHVLHTNTTIVVKIDKCSSTSM